MRLIHYSAKPLPFITSRAQVPRTDGRLSRHDKPSGLWVSDEGEDGWPSWCRANDWGADRLTFASEIALWPHAHILRCTNEAELDELTGRYGFSAFPSLIGIDWEAVARTYQGIIIAPYVRSRRFWHATSWYYGWDCASGCIWDAAAIAAITPRRLPQAAGPERVPGC